LSAKWVSMPDYEFDQLGRRIARLRAQRDWTQQVLADRLAMSRVAVSLLEMDRALPSERTVTLLAGLFKLEPLELVEGTYYPEVKAERLPAVACRHTEMELQLALLRADLTWLGRLQGHADWPRLAREVRQRWQETLESLAVIVRDAREQRIIEEAYDELTRESTQRLGDRPT